MSDGSLNNATVLVAKYIYWVLGVMHFSRLIQKFISVFKNKIKILTSELQNLNENRGF